jgi:hypothetical protein
VLALTNVSPAAVELDGTRLADYLGSESGHDLLSGRAVPLRGQLPMEPYETVWLR